VRSFLVTAGEPVIQYVDPGHGVRGAEITLRGANFNGTTSVTFGGVPASFIPPADPSRMTVFVPPGAKTGFIRVSNSSGTGVSPEIFYPAPWVTSFSPGSAVADTIVEIRGTNLVDATDVYFGGEPVQIVLADPEEIFVLISHGARSGPIQVDTPGGTFMTSSNFTVLPKILDFVPKIGPVGTEVTITGTSFFDVTNVAFNGISATNSWVSSEEIKASVPAGATTGLIRVGTLDGAAFSPSPFTVTVRSDLGVTEVTSTNVVPPGGSLTYVSTVTNLGPSAATGVVLTNSFVPGVDLVSAVSSQGGCNIENGVVGCDLGVVLTNKTATVTIEATFPNSGVYTNTVTVSSVEGDSRDANNTVRSFVVVASDEERTLDIELLSASGPVVISWKVSPVPFRLQFVRELGNTNVNWSNSLVAPFPSNGTNRVTNGASFSEEFYRLAY